MNIRFPFAGALLATAFLSAPAFAQDDTQVDLSSWDEDGDGNVSMEEWDSAIEDQGVFDMIDENGNGVFEIEEADEDLFVYDLEMDIDDGGNIDRQEFTAGTFNNYDANADDQLDEQEFGDFRTKFESSELATG